MRPNRPHMVFTLEDSIVVGGHFYCPSTFGQSLKAGLCEHFFSHTSTNTEHLASEVILHRAIKYYRHCMEAATLSQSGSGKVLLVIKSSHRPDKSAVDFPDLENLAALIVMCLEPHFFKPQEVYNADGEQVPWIWPENLAKDQEHGRRNALWILQQHKTLVPNINSFIEEISQMVEYSMRHED